MASYFNFPRVLILGDSFVSRLKQVFFSLGHPYCRPTFDLFQCAVECFGDGGWTIGDKPEKLEYLKNRVQPVF